MPPKYGTLKIQIVDAQNKPVPFAKVGAFREDTYTNYGSEAPYGPFLNLFSAYNFAGAGKDTGTTDQLGFVTLDSLEANKNYLIMAHSRQPGSIFSQYFLDYDNYDGNFILPTALPGSTVLQIRIRIAPANGWVVFWTDASNANGVPILVNASKNQFGSITGINTSPQINSSGNYITSVRKGYQKFYGSNRATGCAWTIDTNVTAGNFMFVKLGTCDNKIVSFYAADSLASRDVFPIEVTLGQNQVIGSISNGKAGFPTGCSQSDMLNANLSPGQYTYYAKSKNGNCYWTGSFTVGTSSCQLIRLTDCTP